MSLIRLLTTTRSLSDVKNEPSPYRMSEQGLLPKFGPKKRENVARGDAGAPSEAVRRDASPFRKENLGEGNRDRTDAGCSLKSESSRKPRWLAEWWQKLFRRKPRRERREPVQGEFGLDLVRVVRNDLCDTDTAEPPKPEKGKAKSEPPVEESVFGATRG